MTEQSGPDEGGIEPGSNDTKKIFSEAAQKHHDYYVGLDQEGKLPEEDIPNLELAQKREATGEVKPYTPELTDNPSEDK